MGIPAVVSSWEMKQGLCGNKTDGTNLQVRSWHWLLRLIEKKMVDSMLRHITMALQPSGWSFLPRVSKCCFIYSCLVFVVSKSLILLFGISFKVFGNLSFIYNINTFSCGVTIANTFWPGTLCYMLPFLFTLRRCIFRATKLIHYESCYQVSRASNLTCQLSRARQNPVNSNNNISRQKTYYFLSSCLHQICY